MSQGASAPKTPENLSMKAAAAVGFRGMVFHSAEFGSTIADLLQAAPPAASEKPGVVIIGGGKSAQECVDLTYQICRAACG